MGRPHALADPDFAHDVAAAFVAGHTREEMCDLFGVSDPKTITRWRRDPRVQLPARRMLQDRILEITRKTDAIISQRLQNPEDLTTREILDIRKEFTGDKLRESMDPVDEDTVNEAQNFFDSNPDAAEQLRALLTGRALPAAEPS